MRSMPVKEVPSSTSCAVRGEEKEENQGIVKEFEVEIEVAKGSVPCFCFFSASWSHCENEVDESMRPVARCWMDELILGGGCGNGIFFHK